MTEEKGAVGVRVQVPVLGVVTGIQSLEDIIAGVRPEPQVEEPIVATRPLDQPIRTVAARTTPTPTPAPAPTPTPAVTAPPTPKPKPAPAAGESDPEAEAGRLMQLVENYLRAGLKPMALKKLREIVRKYPKTKVSIDAQLKIEELE